MSQTVQITRYPNRRLYDRSRKKYVTVRDIEAMVLGGQDVRVRDSKTDEDLTRVVLTQIILERHPERMKMFPLPFLHAILRADQMSLDWLTVYFGQASSFLDSTRSKSGSSLIPGADFWRAFIPGKGDAKGRERAGGESPPDEVSPPNEVSQAGGADGEPEMPPELAAKFAEMERRIRQLEAESES